MTTERIKQTGQKLYFLFVILAILALSACGGWKAVKGGTAAPKPKNPPPKPIESFKLDDQKATLGEQSKKVDEGKPKPVHGPIKISRTEELEDGQLSSELSRTQAKVEELEARILALSDKLEAVRLMVDNVTGTTAPKKHVIGLPGPAVTKKKHKAKTNLGGRKSETIALFSKAMKLFKKGKYTEAELAFHHFTERFPKHVLAGSAQFYAGESYYMLGEYRLAENEYNKVVNKFPNSPRVASAMVRLAHCYTAIGNTAKANGMLARTKELFEGNPSLEWRGPKPKQDALNTSPIESNMKSPKDGESSHEKNN